MKTFASIPGVHYPPESAPEATIAHAPVRQPKSRRHFEEINGCNVSTTWLNRNSLCVVVIAGERTIVPKWRHDAGANHVRINGRNYCRRWLKTHRLPV